jgi:hypothetical protein
LILRRFLNVTRYINQIARRINQTGNIYGADMEDIHKRQDDIWEQQREILLRLDKVLTALQKR